MFEAECLFSDFSETCFSLYIERANQAKEGKGGTAGTGIIRTPTLAVTGMFLILAGTGIAMVFLIGP